MACLLEQISRLPLYNRYLTPVNIRNDFTKLRFIGKNDHKPMSPKNKPASEKPHMSVILKEMALTIFVHPENIPSSEAAAASLLFSHVAWNRSIGVPMPDKFYKTILLDMESCNPNFWKELKHKDRDIIISKLIAYKQSHYPNDGRIIDACRSLKDKVQVEWHDGLS